MAKSIFHRWFGLGRVPRAMMPILENEGIVLLDEGVSGSVTFRNFRAPGKRYGYRRSWICGSLVVTELRIAAFGFRNPLINVPRDGPYQSKLEGRLEKEGRVLCVAFEAGDFHDGWSGAIEARFETPEASSFLGYLTA